MTVNFTVPLSTATFSTLAYSLQVVSSNKTLVIAPVENTKRYNYKNLVKMKVNIGIRTQTQEDLLID